MYVGTSTVSAAVAVPVEDGVSVEVIGPVVLVSVPELVAVTLIVMVHEEPAASTPPE
jgi:hypothetical protein